VDPIANRDLGAAMAELGNRGAGGVPPTGPAAPVAMAPRRVGNQEAINLVKQVVAAGAKRPHSPEPSPAVARKRQDGRDERDRYGSPSGGGGGRYASPRPGPSGRYSPPRSGSVGRGVGGVDRDRERMPPPSGIPSRGPLADLHRLNQQAHSNTGRGPGTRPKQRTRSQPPNVVKKFMEILPHKKDYKGSFFRFFLPSIACLHVY
jgi:hypothetical protein